MTIKFSFSFIVTIAVNVIATNRNVTTMLTASFQFPFVVCNFLLVCYRWLANSEIGALPPPSSNICLVSVMETQRSSLLQFQPPRFYLRPPPPETCLQVSAIWAIRYFRQKHIELATPSAEVQYYCFIVLTRYLTQLSYNRKKYIFNFQSVRSFIF